jgi:hypothetical protein
MTLAQELEAFVKNLEAQSQGLADQKVQAEQAEWKIAGAIEALNQVLARIAEKEDEESGDSVPEETEANSGGSQAD